MIGIFENLLCLLIQFLGTFRNVKRFVVGMLKKFQDDSYGSHVNFLKGDWHVMSEKKFKRSPKAKISILTIYFISDILW